MPPHWWPPTCQEHLSPLPPLTHQQFSLLVSSGPRTAADFNGVLHFSSAIWKYLESLVDFRWRMILIAVPNAGQWYCHAPARRMKCHLGILACYNLEPEGPFQEMDLSWYNQHLGLSENSVPLNPMVNDHYPY